MTFPTVKFGRIVVTGAGFNYIDGSSIPSGGFRLFIVPITDVGAAGIDIGFTYVNQFGVTKTTTVSTAIGSGTTFGTHIQVVLEPGDTGIRDVIAISYFAGGTPGDNLSLESWNEGLGRPPIVFGHTDIFDRTLPGAHIFEPILLPEWKGKSFDPIYVTPVMYYSNPGIIPPIRFNSSMITDFSPEVIIDRATITKAIEWSKRNDIVSWIPEPLSGNRYAGKPYFVFKSWLESVVGQVLSGYIQNVDGQVIKNAFSMILMSTTPTEITPGGTSTTADVNPDTGLYQAFLKKVVYDQRYIIVKVGIKNIALEGAGIPVVVDGTKQLSIPYNLQFACPVKNCDFTITRKIT